MSVKKYIDKNTLQIYDGIKKKELDNFKSEITSKGNITISDINNFSGTACYRQIYNLCTIYICISFTKPTTIDNLYMYGFPLITSFNNGNSYSLDLTNFGILYGSTENGKFVNKLEKIELNMYGELYIYFNNTISTNNYDLYFCYTYPIKEN